MVKNLPANVRDTGDSGLIPGLERSPQVGSDNPFQYSCLGNPMDRGAGSLQSMGLVTSDMTEHTHSLRAQKPNLANNHPPQVMVSAML